MNNTNYVSGINEGRLDKLALDLLGYIEKINNTLNQISEVVEDTKNYFDSSIANSYRNKYDLFKTNYNVVKKNLSSYSSDLTKVKFKYKGMATNLQTTINKEITKIDINGKW